MELMKQQIEQKEKEVQEQKEALKREREESAKREQQLKSLSMMSAASNTSISSKKEQDSVIQPQT